MLSVVIPAAANGRCTSVAGHKSLFPIGNETIIQRQVRLLRDRFPEAEILVTVGYRREEFIGHLPKDVRLICNTEYNESFVTKSIGMALDVAKFPNTLICYGDLVFSNSIVSQLDIRNDSMVVAEQGTGRSSDVGVVNDGYCATNFAFGLPDRWCQFAYLCERGTRLFRNLIEQPNGTQLFTHEILNRMVDQGFRIRLQFAQPNSFFDIDTQQDYENFYSSQLGNT